MDVKDGDRIVVDIANRSLELDVDEEEMARRRAAWAPLPARFDYGVLRKYAKLVGSAARGAVCE